MIIDILVLEQSDTLIYFRWTATEAVCRVKRGSQVVYTGTQNYFKDEGLQVGHLYTYTIERLDVAGEWTDKIKIQTGTENRNVDNDNRLAEIVLTTIVSEGRVSLAWGKIDGISTFDIYRNGQFIESIKKNQYTDDKILSDQPYTYWIRGKRPVSLAGKKGSEKKFSLHKIFGALQQNSSKDKASMEDFWLTQKIAPLHSLLSDQPNTAPQPVWHFRYNTFLPDTLLKNPNLLSPFHYFKGDNRSFDSDSLEYRTHVNFTVSFNENEPTLSWDKRVGPTIGYNWRKKFSKEDVASANEIDLIKTAESDQKISIALTHGVGNPLTTSPNIDYHLSADFYHDGTYTVLGVHDQSPNHEVYLKYSEDRQWTEIHQSESEGLSYMAGPTANKYWRLSNFC
ncbi:hypothetical protein B481_0328 [Planococcus halocryophilus Or1]|uniref:DUF3238 domain-containing protein n=1 Tax=Planococcus halocryophilus TaxID=1215089 RepID=A0A1C7DU91_9BACL|nr:hypothetical protein [Planococcus halocryophilus]ANU14878.1 hypothetical protein BBI08_13900 [Planococcus halocryophilus]EMF47795.1 hypothetical protein B481_0328 [Planococcus halocryophilus Or1]